MTLKVRPDAPAEPTRGPVRTSGGSWGWILQVVSGALLLVLLGVHLVAQHFVVDAPAGLRDYAQVVGYLGNPVIVVTETLFLLVVTWHAMLGVRAILFDLGFGPTGRRRVTAAVSVLGVVTACYGLWLIAVIAT